MGAEMPYDKDDFRKYKSGCGTLVDQSLIVCLDLHEEIDCESKAGILNFLNATNAVMIGRYSWALKTALPPHEIVNCIRRFFVNGESVSVFTVSVPIAWAGPRIVTKFFESFGVRILESAETPRPAAPEPEET